jgi:hypothetical protein
MEESAGYFETLEAKATGRSPKAGTPGEKSFEREETLMSRWSPFQLSARRTACATFLPLPNMGLPYQEITLWN